MSSLNGENGALSRSTNSLATIYFLLQIVVLIFQNGCTIRSVSAEFVRTRGTQFVVTKKNEISNGEHDQVVFYPNGFNAYWLMDRAADVKEKDKVSLAMRQASQLGLNVVRTWAFSDGGYKPLQHSPGSYDQSMFEGLDMVIAEAKKYGIYLILSLVNNHEDFGGRRQYIEWAKEFGQDLRSDDDFYTNTLVKEFYKNHVKTVLTRNNTVTGTTYKDDPIILAWELMNEPQCLTDLSGKTLQGWIAEMAAYVKSIDNNHMVEVGLEGFYGDSIPSRKLFNPPGNTVGVGSDFITNNLVAQIDFATVHAYPDLWVPESDNEAQLSFLRSWITSHIQDANAILKKPLVIAEFGKSTRQQLGEIRSSAIAGNSISEEVKPSRWRNVLYATVYKMIYASAKAGGPCTGGMFWQLLVRGMDELSDGYEIIVSETPSIAKIIFHHSYNIWKLENNYNNNNHDNIARPHFDELQIIQAAMC